MKTLIVDTSSEYCLLALAQGDSLLSHTLFLHANRLSQALLPDISTLLQNAHCSLKEIDQIAIGVGPGSYTGTRIGVAVARSLSYGLNLPLRGFCSLIAFLPNAVGSFASILPAKSGLFYILAGDRLKNRITIHQAELISLDTLRIALHSADIITARRPEDLPATFPIEQFLPFHPNPENIIHALQTPPSFPFETDVQLIYLNELL